MSDIKSLGYVKVQTNDIDRWCTFAFDVLGFAKGTGPDSCALYLRMDERAARIVVTPGETDEIVTVGWEVRDRPALLRVQETLQSAGVDVKPLPQDEADARRVEEAITFCDPTGTTIELFHGAALDHSPVVTPFGARFVTGAQGLGHVVLPATDPSAAFTVPFAEIALLQTGNSISVRSRTSRTPASMTSPCAPRALKLVASRSPK